MADNLDPRDVGALERAVNDSAGRVSTIWISFLVFGLYLAVAVGGVTHRQLLLEGAIKLPALNIDLPLVSFFFLAPLLFVILHAYVLLQVVLLARTAAAYNEALDRRVPSAADRGVLRQRLVNTLFAQIFAGSPREREGLLGMLLRLMAWVTLAIAPVLVLLTIEVRFLPYHSVLVTWTHRALILLDLGALLLLWRGALEPAREITWRGMFAQRSAVATAAVLAVVSLLAVNYPGEPHTSWMRFGNTRAPICGNWLGVRLFGDRPLLSSETLIDVAKLEREVRPGPTTGIQESTQNLAGRDLRCASFADADLRGADLREATLRGATSRQARLQGANLASADLREADLYATRLEGASLAWADMRKANVQYARLYGADLTWTDLGWADLRAARLQGATLQGAGLVGSNFGHVQAQGAVFEAAKLSSTDFSGAWLWRAALVACDSIVLKGARFDATVDVPTIRGGEAPPEATPEAITEFVDKVTASVPAIRRDDVQTEMSRRLAGTAADDEKLKQWWNDCAAKKPAAKAP